MKQKTSSITLNNVSLDFIAPPTINSIKKTVLHRLSRLLRYSNLKERPQTQTIFRGLSNITLSISDGDRVGILGKNGAGKSTLLKLIANIYPISEGSLYVEGKVSSLFDINLGMNMESTGYENIINLLVIRGVSKKEVRKLMPDIVSFTELDLFLNQPVKTYSAGMKMKLGFAVATSLSADILLIDEVIGTGDHHFMKKALCRLEEKIKNSHILLLASHSNQTLRKFCNKCIILSHGSVKFFGGIEEGITLYETNQGL